MFKRDNQYGVNTKRGKSKVSIEVKERLQKMTPDVYKALEKGIKNNEFLYIKLWFEYMYGRPQIKLEIKQTNKILQISFNEGKEVEIIAPKESINSGNNL